MFQFQLGAIGSSSGIIDTSSSTVFQFQLGAIGSFKPHEEKTLNLVSIPAWCDWESTAAGRSYVAIMFQFQLGAIGSFFDQFAELFEIRFNSSLVRLGDCAITSNSDSM